jgi:hypothetical protein
MNEFVKLVKSVIHHWKGTTIGAGVSGLLSGIAYFHLNVPGWASGVATAICSILTGLVLAWREEYRKVLALEKQVCPKLSIDSVTVTEQPGFHRIIIKNESAMPVECQVRLEKTKPSIHYALPVLLCEMHQNAVHRTIIPGNSYALFDVFTFRFVPPPSIDGVGSKDDGHWEIWFMFGGARTPQYRVNVERYEICISANPISPGGKKVCRRFWIIPQGPSMQSVKFSDAGSVSSC